MIMSAIKYQVYLNLKEQERMNFADYCATEEQRQKTNDEVSHYAVMLCDALYMDYKRFAMQSHNHAIAKGDSVEYHQSQVTKLYESGPDVEYYLETGRKYYKLIMQYKDSKSRSVHCFIDKKTGQIFKPASWKAPAKGARYNLLDANSREECYRRADWSGGYLYLR